MKNIWMVAVGAAFGVVFGLLGAGLVLLLSRAPKGKPIILQPIPTAMPLKIHVTGAVVQPGLYEMPPGSRVQDAIQTAGGLNPDAATDNLNLAALVQDGEHLNVPRHPSAPQNPPIALQERSGSLPTPQTAATAININTASQADLESLPDIGKATALKIIAYRQQHGAFTTIEQIQDVPGIGAATFAKIKDLITVTP